MGMGFLVCETGVHGQVTTTLFGRVAAGLGCRSPDDEDVGCGLATDKGGSLDSFEHPIVLGLASRVGLRLIEESTSVAQLNVSIVSSPLLSASSASASHITSATLRSAIAF